MFVVTQLNLEKLAEVLERVLFSFWQSCNIKKKKRGEKLRRILLMEEGIAFLSIAFVISLSAWERRERFFLWRCARRFIWDGRVNQQWFACLFWVENLVCFHLRNAFFFLVSAGGVIPNQKWIERRGSNFLFFFFFSDGLLHKKLSFLSFWALLLFDGPGIRLTGERARWLAEHLIFWGVRCASDNPWKSRGKNHSLAQSYS